MGDTMSVAGAPSPRSRILDHLDLVERLIRSKGLHDHHQADEYRSVGYYTVARLAVAGNCDGMDDPRPYLAACILNAIRKTRKHLGAAHRYFVQCPDERPAGSTLPSREVPPDRMAMLREEHNLDHLDSSPVGPSPFARRVTPAEVETIRGIIAENPEWGLIKIARRFRELTESPIAPSTVRRVRMGDAIARKRADLEVARYHSERDTSGRFGRTG